MVLYFAMCDKRQDWSYTRDELMTEGRTPLCNNRQDWSYTRGEPMTEGRSPLCDKRRDWSYGRSLKFIQNNPGELNLKGRQLPY